MPVETGTVRQVFVLENRQGLHCRPAALLINTIKDLACEVRVESNGAVANGRSLFDLMSLAAGFRTTIAFTITGPEAQKAMAAIQRLFENRFAEAYDEDHPLSNARMPVL